MTLSHVDAPRLSRLLGCVSEVMAQGEWLSLSQIVRECAARGVNGTEASVSARLRQLRNDYGRRVDKKRVGDPASGAWVYRVEPIVKVGEQGRLFA